MTVSIKVGAELDTAQIQRQLDDLTRRINATGQAIARAGHQRFDPIPRATVEMAQRLERTMRNIQHIAPELGNRLKATGQTGVAFDKIDFNRMYGREHHALAARRSFFTMATGLGIHQLDPLPGPQIPGVAPNARPGGASYLASILPGLQRALPAAGPFGTATARGIAAGRAAQGGLGAGLQSGLGAGLGFAAVAGAGMLIGGVRNAFSAAQQESIAYADLYRHLGGRGSGNFHDGLRQRMRGVSDRVSVGYDEVIGLARSFAGRSGLSSGADLAAAVEHSAGFARSFGLDPESGVGLFAGLRGAKAVRDTEAQRRLGLDIAEGIAAAGVFSKAEDYLAEMVRYGEQTARATVSAPNIEGFNSYISGLIRGGRPGMDIHGAAALMHRADAAIQGGGAMGEAGQAFLYQALGRRLGLDPLQVQTLQEGGLFATGANTFGPGTVAGDFYRSAGYDVGRAGADGTPVAGMVLDGLRRQYGGGNRRLLANAAANLLGLNSRQAMALLEMTPEQMRGAAGLGLSDEQMRRLTATGIQTMGRIGAPTTTRAELDRIADEFAARQGGDALSPGERGALDRARGGDSMEDFRRVLAQIAAGREAERTEGDQTRAGIQNVEKVLQRIATGLIGPVNTMRDALLTIAGGQGRALTPTEVSARVRDAEIREVDAQAFAELAAIQETEREVRGRMSDTASRLPGQLPPGARERVEAEGRAELERLRMRREEVIARRDRGRADARATHEQAINGERARRRALQEAPGAPAGADRAALESYLRETDRLIGAPEGFSAAQVAQESSWNPNAVSRAGAQGLAQVMPGTRAALERRLGRPLDPFNPQDAVLMHRMVMQENVGHFGNHRDAARAYNGGWNPQRWGNSETSAYVPAIERRMGRPLPPGAPAQAALTQGASDMRLHADAEVRVQLENSRGERIAPGVVVHTLFRPAQPYGAMQPR